MANKSKMIRINREYDSGGIIALYIRVSTDRQAEEGYSIEAQKERLAAYVTSVGDKNSLTEFYVDDGHSGASLERPEMTRLIEDVKSGKVRSVMVYKLDRLSRSQKDTLYLIEDVFLPHNVDFVSIQESFNTATPFGRAVVGILSVFAQLERENIFERTRLGMQKRVEEGLWPGGGRIPFGYDYDRENGILVPNADAPKVKRIYELYLKGYSLQRIADMLGLKYEKLAYQIITRKSNAGYIVYNGIEYKGQHQAIISPEVYEEAMALMLDRSARRFVSTTDHLLTGLVYCGKCGAKMRYQKWGKAGYKFVCYSQQRSKLYLVRDPDCDNTRPWADELEAIVIGDIFRMTEQNMSAPDEGDSSVDVLDVLRDQHDAEAKKLKRLYRLYSDASDDTLLELISESRSALKAVETNIKLEEERGLLSMNVHRARQELRSIADIWEYMTVHEKQNAIRSIVDKITVTGDATHINYKV